MAECLHHGERLVASADVSIMICPFNSYSLLPELARKSSREAQTGLPVTRLLHHLNKHFLGLRRIRNFSQEADAHSAHAIVGFQSQVEA